MGFAPLDFAFVRRLIAEFAMAAPVGPVVVLCTRRALSTEQLQAFTAGLGAAVADMIFGAVVGLGIGATTVFVLDHEVTIGLIAGFIILAVGIGTYRTPVTLKDGATVTQRVSRDFAATFGMAITNPVTMIAAVGLFAAFVPVDMYAAPMTAVLLIAGVFVGSAAAWLILSGVVGTFREAFLERGLPHLNHISGAVIALSGTGVLIAAPIKIARLKQCVRIFGRSSDDEVLAYHHFGDLHGIEGSALAQVVCDAPKG